MSKMKMKYKKLNNNQCVMLRRRGLDPTNYVVLRETYVSLYLRDVRDGSVKIIMKYN